MMRVGLFSKDRRLSSLLSSTLAPDVELVPISACESTKHLAGEAACGVWIVDTDSMSDPLAEWRAVLDNSGLGSRAQIIIMTTDENRFDVLPVAQEFGHDCMRKPPVIRELKLRLQRAYDGQVLKGELEKTRRSLQSVTGLDQLNGCSAPMLCVYDVIRRVAKLDTPVLVTGESGTGKELVARAIHNLGKHANRPFVAVSCGAIPETLIESELFGHEKGAFTGAMGQRQGFLEQAGDGTLFFDEIGEISPATQVKLLRVLQQREFYRLGSSRPIPLRARVVFATHRNLQEMVAQGQFRQDLFYRVNVMNINLPALRDRTEDIPMLVQLLLRRFSDLHHKAIEGIDPDALLLLRKYQWIGNVRELENVLQHAVIMAEGDVVRSADLPQTIQDLEIGEDVDDLPAGSFDRLVRDFKIKLVKEAIAQCNGNKTLASQSLSISRAYLHRLIRPLSPLPLDELGAHGHPIEFPDLSIAAR
jgi:DNA-binding NtrC family response regulator